MPNHAYITVLTNDTYLPGTLVLGRSLRDFNTTKKLVVLASNISDATVDLLKEVYDEIIPVTPILSTSLEELSTLGRIDLVATYTKILVWSQEQFDKVVYLDSDVLPTVPIDDFFDIELNSEDALIAAAPDSGWPDIFNSGVFIATPSKSTLNDLLNTIQTKETPSFDGADQGLLNEYFLGKWKRLPFTFNVTPSAGYQYVPAYARFFNDIKIIHFIGINKPWLTRDSNIFAASSFGKGYEILTKLHQQWWNVFNRHYFGKIAGDIFDLSKTKLISDQTSKGEAWTLNVPKLQNQWDDQLTISNVTEEIQEESATSPAQIFPWEGQREEPTRVFDESTDFHVQNF